MGVYERIPELHSLELATAPCFSVRFSLHLGVYKLSPRQHSLLVVKEEGVLTGTYIIYPHDKRKMIRFKQ